MPALCLNLLQPLLLYPEHHFWRGKRVHGHLVERHPLPPACPMVEEQPQLSRLPPACVGVYQADMAAVQSPRNTWLVEE